MSDRADDAALENELQRKYGPYFSVADELAEIAREMAEDRPLMFHSAFDGLAAFFFAKSYKTFSAISTLCRRGFGEDAAVLSRGLVENATTLFFISLDRDERSNLYLEYEYVARNKYISMLEAAGAADFSSAGACAARDKLRELYQSVKVNYPNENLWSGKSVRQMAEEVGLMPHYLFAYKYFSDIAHGGPSTVGHVLEPGDSQGFIGIVFGPDEAFVAEALIWSCDLFWRVLAKNNEIFSIDFDDRLREVALRMRHVFRGSQPTPFA